MTITVLDLIDANIELRKIADTFYQEIQNWYRHDDRGNVVKFPMNIPAGTKGESIREGHDNSFIVGQRYFRFLSLDLDATKVKALLDEFVENFISYEHFFQKRREIVAATRATKSEDVFYTLPEKFLPQHNQFKNKLIAYHSMLANYKSNPKSQEIELRLLFAQMSARLIKEDKCTLEVVNEACIRARSTIASKNETLTLNGIYELNKNFSGMMAFRFIHFKHDPKSNQHELQTEDASEQIRKLTVFLQKLPNLQTLDIFKGVFAETLFRQTRSQKNAWNTVSLFHINQNNLLSEKDKERRQLMLNEIRGFKK